MAEKLSESVWTGYVKKQKLELDDKALVKALAAFDKADEAKPEPRLKALEEVIKQIPEQVKGLVKRKKELGDKPFGEAKDKLYALLEEAEALQKKTQAAAAAADKQDDDEEPDTPVLLTTKMVPLLRELRKGEVQMNAMICTAGKNTAVLIMRRSISPSRRKLLAEAVDAKGGMKYIVGECKFENKVLTFVVQSPASQLAKRIRQALLEQTEMRFKVKVRGDDGVEEHDGEDEGEEQPGAQPQGTPAPPGGPASAEQIAYVQRLRKVRERYEQALKDQHPEATKLRAVMGYASEKADGQKDYAAAIKALDMVEKLLGAPAVGGKPAEATAPGANPSAASTSSVTSASTAAADEPMARGTPKAPPMDPTFAFKSRLTGLVPRLKPVEVAGGPVAAQVKAKREEAVELVRQKGATPADVAKALALLDDIEALIVGAEGEAGAGSGPKVAAATGAKVVFQQTRLAWDQTRKQVQVELRKLEQAILEQCKNQPDMQVIVDGTKNLYTILEYLDERLIDKLDDALNAGTPEERAGLHQEAREIVDEYLDYVKGEELFNDIDDNGFVPVAIAATLNASLGSMAKQLRAAVVA